MSLPNLSRKQIITESASPVVAYSYEEIAEGAGFVRYYLYTSKNNSAADYHLTNNANIYSKEPYTSAAVTTIAKVIDLDFDLIMNKPQDIKGTAITQFFVGGGATSGTIAIYLVVNVCHYNGTTETVIGTATSDTETWSTTARKVFVVPVPIAALKHFAPGETLRVTVEVWGVESEGASITTVNLQHDPVDRAAAVNDLPTNSNILIPYKIR